MLIGLGVGSWLWLKGHSRTLWVNYLLLSLVLVMGGRRLAVQVSWRRVRGSVLVHHDQQCIASLFPVSVVLLCCQAGVMIHLLPRQVEVEIRRDRDGTGMADECTARRVHGYE